MSLACDDPPMSLATRCTACGTVFRVVQDQLKVSEGWVRCGRCNKVFNALEGLFDLARDTPPNEHIAAAPMPVPHATEPVAAADDPTLIDKIDAQLLGTHRSEGGSTPSTRISERDRLEFPDAQFDPELLAGDSVTRPELPLTAEMARDFATETVANVPAPEFMRASLRESRWHGAPVRSALAVLALVLVAGLSLQLGHQFRDLIAARWPTATPALTALCDLMTCAIEAPRRIDDVSVESSTLTRAAMPDTFELSVALRNRGALTVALPSVDLSLTDPAGQLLARRALAPRDFGAAPALLRPGAESHLGLVLTAGSARVTGYTVEIFYP